MPSVNMHGLGVLYKTDPDTGAVIDCDDSSNFFQSVCWNPFASSVIPSSGGTDSSGNPLPLVAAVAAAAAPSASSGVSSTVLIAGLAAVGLLLVFMGVRR